MRLKSHPWTKLTTLVAVSAVTVGMAGFVALAQAGPAGADPTIQFAEVGSDTIQDVMNQFSVDVAGNLLGSFNAVDPVTGAIHGSIAYVKGANATEPAVSCNFTRPNGSTEGLDAFRFSINPLTTASQDAVPPQAGCVDLSRSSSGPSSSDVKPDGQLVYIPFAIDAVTGAVGPTTAGEVNGSTGENNVAATLLTSTAAPYYDFVNYLTIAELTSLYSCPVPSSSNNEGAVSIADPMAPGGTLLVNPNVGVQGLTSLPTGQTQIDLYIPQSGSGTLSFWAGQLGFSKTSPPPCDHQTIVNAATTPPAGSSFSCPPGSATGCGVTTYDGVTVEEHNGQAIGVDPNGYFPFSIAQWLSQSHHSNIDRRYGAQLQNVTNASGTVESPCLAAGAASNCSTTGSSINANNFPFVRFVYNIAQYDQVQSTDTSTYIAALGTMLVGTGSSLCSDGLQLFLYGFAQMPSTNSALNGDQCGTITDPNLRVYDASDPI
jgi:hypothetical protein